jgi:hypothetical protein
MRLVVRDALYCLFATFFWAHEPTREGFLAFVERVVLYVYKKSRQHTANSRKYNRICCDYGVFNRFYTLHLS